MKQKRTPVAFDIECYKNYFLVVFMTQDGNKMSFKMHNNLLRIEDQKVIHAILRENPLVGFNSINYDIILLSAFLSGYTNERLKELSDTIIVKGIARWQINDYFPDLRIKEPTHGHIDLVGVTPLKASLKAYGCRIHSKKLQDLPIEPDAHITTEQAAVLEAYCENDVQVTWDIYKEMLPELMLRFDMTNTYGMDLRSKSDAQIAEAIIRHRMEEAGHRVEKRKTEVVPFKYTMPEFIKFESDVLNHVRNSVQECTFRIKDTGSVELPKEISQVIEFDGAKYKLGIGGLHSQEKKQVVEPKAGFVLGEYDVASMYPSIIIGQNLYPEHLGEDFIDVYKEIFTERLDAKRSGNKTVADTLKIVLNSSYGKFGSKYSFLYSPELLIQTTLSGQLALLMLIERVTAAGAKVVSANTDGINVLMRIDEKPHIDSICDQWSRETSYQLEWTEYLATYSESVNSYVALKPDGGAKTKGLFESGSIRKGYSAQVCNDAVVEYIKNGTDVEQWIRSETDVRKFLVMRGVRGGAIWRGDELGKVVRWYYSLGGEPIRYKNGNKVAGSDSARPMMDLLNRMPYDLDYQAYVDIANKKIKRLGL